MKKVLMFVVAMFIAVQSFSQMATKNYGILENTFVGVQGGASVPLDFNSVFPMNGNVGITAGKWITPVIGVDVEGNVWLNSNHFVDSKTVVHASNIGFNVLLDGTNLVGGFKPYRKFSIIPEAGLGWLHTYGNVNNYLSAKTAVALNVRPSKKIGIFVEPVVWWNLSARDVQFDRHHAQLGLQVGITYRFKNKDNTRTFTQYDIVEYMNTINSLRKDLAEKPKVITKEVVKEVIKEVNKTPKTAIVFFAKASDEIMDYNILNKIDSTVAVEVHGFASPEGTDKFNKDLSLRRANAVANYLKSRGLTIKKVVGHGASGKTSNRVVFVY